MSDPVTAATDGSATRDRICEHDECCDYYLCAHPKCCGYRGRPSTAAADGSPDPRSGMVAALAEVLAVHPGWDRDPFDGEGFCTGCDWTCNEADSRRVDAAHRAHVAAALAPTVERLLAEGRAEALEGAARRMLNTVDPLLPGHEARMACVRVVREGGE